MNDACDSGLGVLDVLKLLRKFPFAFGVLDPTHVLIRLAKQVVRYRIVWIHGQRMLERPDR